jgi:ABC-2 type transport system permease protein
MMEPIRLLIRYGSASMRAQMQYPLNAIMLAVGQFTATMIDMVAIWALFARFGALDGWTLGDIAMFFGLVSISFSIADFLTRGFDVLGSEFIKTGQLDRLLLRPRTLTLQLIGNDMRLSRFGRMTQGLVVLAIGTASLHFNWTLARIAIAFWTIAGGIALFFGLMVIQGALAFWTTESLEAMNVLTYGGVQAAQYPLSIYERWFRAFLTFIVPIGCVAYFPVLALLGKSGPIGMSDSWFLVLPFAGFVFLGVAFVAWHAGLRKYTSTGS